jgi:hypothetical protein
VGELRGRIERENEESADCYTVEDRKRTEETTELSTTGG